MLPLVLIQQPAPRPEPPPPPPPGGPLLHPPFLPMAEELGLSDDQVAKLKAVHKTHREALGTRHEALRSAQKALMEAVQGGGDLKALHEIFAQAHLAALLEARALHAESLALLTPEQQAKAKALRASHPDGRGPGRSGRSGGEPSAGRPPHPPGDGG